MKKLLFTALLALSFGACQEAKTDSETASTANEQPAQTVAAAEEKEKPAEESTDFPHADKILTSETGKSLPLYHFEGFEKDILSLKDGEELYVVNFWATWCGPCVKELPYFNALEEELAGKVKFLYVSLDFTKSLEKKLLPFIDKEEIGQVVFLDQKKVNEWLPKIDKDWSGAIPATLILGKGQHQFYRQSFHSSEELKAILPL